MPLQKSGMPEHLRGKHPVKKTTKKLTADELRLLRHPPSKPTPAQKAKLRKLESELSPEEKALLRADLTSDGAGPSGEHEPRCSASTKQPNMDGLLTVKQKAVLGAPKSTSDSMVHYLDPEGNRHTEADKEEDYDKLLVKQVRYFSHEL